MDINSAPEDAQEKEEETKEVQARSAWSFLPIVAFTLFFHTALMSQRSVIPQYIFKNLLEKNGLPASYSNSSICHINKSDPMYQRREEVQAQTSLIASKISIMEGIPQIVMVLIYGAYSDEMGRKLTIFVPYCGAAVWTICICLMINLDLPFYTYFIGSVINGFSGSFGTMLSGVFAYLADTTTKKQRTLAIGMLEASLGMSIVISSYAVGYWLKAEGAKVPSIAITSLLCASLVFLFCVKESVVRPQHSPNARSGIGASLKRQLTKIKTLFTAHRGRGICLGLCIGTFSLHIFCVLGGMSLLTLYALNEPFCWTSDYIGIYTGSTSAFWQVGMFLVLLLLRKRLSDWWLAYMALISFTCFNGLLSAASLFDFPADNILMFAASASGVFVRLSAAMIRAICSKTVNPDEQGVMFAIFAAAETISIVLGSAILNQIFALTLNFFSGFVFALMAIIELVAIGILGIAHYIQRSHTNDGYTSL